MFTVKWIKREIGYEEVFDADRVWIRDDADGHIFYVKRGDDIVPFKNGDFYVMNPNGKTVADYHLGTAMQGVGMPPSNVDRIVG